MPNPQLWATSQGGKRGAWAVQHGYVPQPGGHHQAPATKPPHHRQQRLGVQRARSADPGAPTSPARAGPGKDGGGHGAATGNWLQGKKGREKHRRGFKKTEMKESDGEKRMREGEEKRRRDSRGLQGVNFLTERRTQHRGTKQPDAGPRHEGCASPPASPGLRQPAPARPRCPPLLVPSTALPAPCCWHRLRPQGWHRGEQTPSAGPGVLHSPPRSAVPPAAPGMRPAVRNLLPATGRARGYWGCVGALLLPAPLAGQRSGQKGDAVGVSPQPDPQHGTRQEPEARGRAAGSKGSFVL